MDDDDDYQAATDEQLQALLAHRAPEIVERALIEWRARNSRAAAQTAKGLLVSASDQFLLATALATLWDGDRRAARDYIEANAASCAIPVLVRMLEILATSDDEWVFQRPALIAQLQARLDELPDSEWALRPLFLARFPQ